MRTTWALLPGIAKYPAEGAVLLLVLSSQLEQTALALWREMHLNLAAVILVSLADDESGGFASRDKRGGAIGRRLQPFGEFPDGGPLPPSEPAHVKHQLILKRCDPRRAGDFFGHAQKLA